MKDMKKVTKAVRSVIQETRGERKKKKRDETVKESGKRR